VKTEFWTKKYDDLKAALEAFISGRIDSAELKKNTAPLGIYEQKNGKFMLRIRITGGEIPLDKLKRIVEISFENGITHVHLTTRQCIQLHNAAAEKVYPVVSGCVRADIPFRGGGGDTFRNICASHCGGLSKESVFDVIPYAKALNEFIFSCDKAFALPRKFKIGLFCSEAESCKAEFQDLGFIAKKENGTDGFSVFSGGGMGRESVRGIKIFDFIHAKDLFKCAKAAIELFYEHGDRTNRAKARLRFFAAKIGEEQFTKIFTDYYDKTDAPACGAPIENYSLFVKRIRKNFPPEYDAPKSEIFSRWILNSVHPTILGDDIKSAVIPVPFGDLTPDELSKIITIAEETGSETMRISQDQKLFLPLVHKNALARLFKNLAALDKKFVSEPSEEIPVACVGSKICKIGILDSPSIASGISERLKKLLPKISGDKSDAVSEIIKGIKISGCHNSCGAHIAAPLGIQGFRKKIGEDFIDYVKIFSAQRASADPNELPAEKICLPLQEALDLIEKITQDFINSKIANFANFINNYNFNKQ
jgi:sulfite reductase beta subunit-like hemoprotein